MDDWRPDIQVEGLEPSNRPADERAVLGVVMEHGRSVPDRTTERIAETTGLDATEVARTLRRLETEGIVERDTDTGLGIEFWRSTPKAADVFDPPPQV